MKRGIRWTGCQSIPGCMHLMDISIFVNLTKTHKIMHYLVSSKNVEKRACVIGYSLSLLNICSSSDYIVQILKTQPKKYSFQNCHTWSHMLGMI